MSREAMSTRKQDLLERIEAIRRRYQQEIEPYMKALADIAACEPPAPVVMPDGRVWYYIGPLHEWREGELPLSPSTPSTT